MHCQVQTCQEKLLLQEVKLTGVLEGDLAECTSVNEFKDTSCKQRVLWHRELFLTFFSTSEWHNFVWRISRSVWHDDIISTTCVLCCWVVTIWCSVPNFLFPFLSISLSLSFYYDVFNIPMPELRPNGILPLRSVSIKRGLSSIQSSRSFESMHDFCPTIVFHSR